MAASKRTSVPPVQRSNRGSVPQKGSPANARKSVAGSKSVGRTATKSGRASQAVLPVVQPTKRLPTANPSDRYPTVDPTVLASAFGRAYQDNRWQAVSWDPTKNQWEVPSATDARRSYRVWRRRGRRGPLPFYVALECNCQAEQSGSYIVCWHKCAVKLWLNEWFHEQALERELADDPPDDEEV